MPCTIIARPPGGASSNVPRQYAVCQKLQLLEECNHLQRSWNHSIHSATVEMGISPCLLASIDMDNGDGDMDNDNYGDYMDILEDVLGAGDESDDDYDDDGMM